MDRIYIMAYFLPENQWENEKTSNKEKYFMYQILNIFDFDLLLTK